MSFNKIILVGNLGRDPELRYTPQQKAVCSFSMATNERRRDKAGEWQDVPTWFRVTLWGNQAENAAKYLTKGSPVFIEGRLKLEEWTDRDNNTRYTLEVTGTDMHFIGSRNTGGEYNASQPEDGQEPQYTGGAPSATSPTTASAAAPSAPTQVAPAAGDDDIPF